MKKKVFSLICTVLVCGSLMSVKNSKRGNLNEETPTVEASCFEQGHYYSLWWRSVTGGSAIEGIQVALAYQEICEQEKKLQMNQRA